MLLDERYRYSPARSSYSAQVRFPRRYKSRDWSPDPCVFPNFHPWNVPLVDEARLAGRFFLELLLPCKKYNPESLAYSF